MSENEDITEPLVIILPATCNLSFGAIVPIPTLPLL